MKEKAVVLIEFLFVLPLLVLVIFLGIEFSRALYYMQIAASLSHQAANLVYRDCVGDPSGNPESAEHVSDITGVVNRQQIDTCLEARRQIIQRIANRMAPGSTISVSLYRFDKEKKLSARFPDAPAKTRLSWQDKESGIVRITTRTSPLFGRSHLVAGEAFIRFDTVLSAFWQLVGGAPTEFYDILVL